MRIVTRRDRTVTQDGAVYIGVGSGALVEQQLPTNVVGLSRKPVFVTFKRRKLILGQFSRPLIVLEDRRVYEAGIRPPQTWPTLSPGSAADINGTVVGACTFRQRINNKIIHESDRSPESGAVALVNQGRLWTNIPTDADDRVTHVVGYYSFEGDEFREAWERPIGITTVDETIGALARDDVIPDIHDLVIPPYTGYGHAWHARAWYAGLDHTHPYRAWYSEPNKPETIEGHIDTLGLEPITGIYARDDILILFVRRTKYQVRGYTFDDFKIDRMRGYGCLSHHSIKEDISGQVWWAAEEGIVVDDQYAMADLRTYWRRDLAAFPDAFDRSWAIHDRKFSVYKLCTPRAVTPKSFYYLVSYFPDIAPACSFDIRGREDTAAYYDDNGNVITGSCDGIIRRENVDSNGNDDGDSYAKRVIIRTGHLNMGRPGGDTKEGKNLVRLWTYVTSETTNWTLYAIGGDEDVWRQLSNEVPIDPYQVIIDNTRHFWREIVPFSVLVSQTPLNVGLGNWLFDLLPETVHVHLPENVSGRGFVIQIDATAPIGLRYSGFGGLWEPGETSRGAVFERSV